MNLRNHREINQFAAQRLQDSPSQQKIVVIYAALALGLTALVTVLSHVLGLQIDNFGGLSNMGKRTMLSSMQTMLPIAQSLLHMCLDLGYVAAMLRISRGMYTSPQTLRLGFDRFWLLLRCGICKALRYLLILFVSIYAGVMIFMLLPISQPAMEVLNPYLAQMSALSGELVLDEAAYVQFAQAVWPAYLICGVLFGLIAIPLWYSYRLTTYLVIDKPGLPALLVLRESKQMMRNNRLSLLKLDLGFWWFYLVQLLASAVCYGDVILPLLGMELPGSGDLWYLAFMVFYYVIEFSVIYFLRSRVEVSYALAYDSLKAEEPQNDGVVLGNIFQM